MDQQRRRFLLSAAFASAAALRFPSSAIPAESGDASGAEAGRSHETSADGAVVLLDAHAGPSDPKGDAHAALTYGQVTPGPILRLKKDAPSKIRLVNHLTEATSLDWHGMRLPNGLETVPGLKGDSVAPGGTAEIVLAASDSGSYWLHPGLIPGLSDQTTRGLAGVIIVEEADAPQVDSDKVLFLTDEPLRVGEPDAEHASPPLPATMVNGHPMPVVESFLPGARLRLRIVNGSTRRALAATFQGARALVVAIDGQPSELFAPLNDTVPVGPGARFDVMIDLPRTPGVEFKLLLRGPAAAASRPAYVAKTEGTPPGERDPIRPLSPNPSLPRFIPLEHSARADMVAQRRSGAKPSEAAAWTVNGFGGAALPKKPLFSVKRNTPVTLGFSNKSTELTAFRLHGHAMRLLHAMDDGWEPYWRDSVLVPPGVTHHAAFLADNPGRWLIESPFFEQATAGLRTWFEVL